MQKYRIFDKTKQQNLQKDKDNNFSSGALGLGRSIKVTPRLLKDIENDKEKKSKEQIIKRLRQENEELKARLAKLARSKGKKEIRGASSKGGRSRSCEGPNV